MRFMHGRIPVETASRFQTINVTSKIANWLKEINAHNGILVVYSPHTTATVTVNEAESGLMDDILEVLKQLTYYGKQWKHNRIDNNAHAHLGSILVGNSIIIPVVEGRMELGTWQQVLFIEMDGPRRRTLRLYYLGE